MVEARVRKWQSASVSDVEVDACVAVSSLGVLDVNGRKINATHAADCRVPRKAEAQIACAAPDVQDALGSRDPREVNEQGRKAMAPSAHLDLVTVPVRGCECR
jgi:hypothetical protein